jgi:hypothetical protein
MTRSAYFADRVRYHLLHMTTLPPLGGKGVCHKRRRNRNRVLRYARTAARHDTNRFFSNHTNFSS